MANTVKKNRIKMEKRSRRAGDMAGNSGRSKYARKAEYCKKHGVMGWEVKEPKPWK